MIAFFICMSLRIERNLKGEFLPKKWTLKNRIEKASDIMTFSPRDWSQINPTHYDDVYFDAESWAIWCLICCDTREIAIYSWNDFLDDYKTKRINKE